jgi:hypothetical protein
MKFEVPKNANYAATVVKITNIIPLEGCDNIIATTILGYQAIIGKDIKKGSLGIMFPAETQLSPEFVKENNLFRHPELNKNSKEKGYIEDSRRVKAVKFRGHRSDCLFIELKSLKWTGIKIKDLKEDDTFDFINDKEICRKYVLYESNGPGKQLNQIRKFKRVDEKYIPQHIDCDQYLRVANKIPDNAYFIVTQKLHGTSIRIANTIVKRKLNIFERLLKKVGVKIQQTEMDYVFGSRKVIKDVNNPDQKHFYDVDIWTTEGKKLEGLIPEQFIVYGELIGYTPTGGAIQTDYTYDLTTNLSSLYIYRVAFVNETGFVVDLSFDQMVEFCKQRGLKYVPVLWRGYKKDFKVEEFIDKRFYDGGNTTCVKLSHPTLPDEGICMRIDGMTPYITKTKSPTFLQHETKLLDKGVIDMESVVSSKSVN